MNIIWEVQRERVIGGMVWVGPMPQGLRAPHGSMNRALTGAIAAVHHWSRYDEEEMAPSPEQQQAVVPFKLTRQELANLVPQVLGLDCSA